MKRAMLGFAATVLPFALGGCADFGEQTTYFYHDAEHDALHVLLIYQRIAYRGDPAEAQAQLDEFVLRPWQIALGDNWLGHLTKQDLERIAADRSSTPAQKRLAERFLGSVDVANGRFYPDKEKGLCGYQVVTLRNVSELLRALNQVVSEAMLEDPPAGKAPFEIGERSRRLMLKAAELRHAWFALDGQALRFRCPLDDVDYRAWKRAFLSRAEDPSTDALRSVRPYLIENDLSLTREGEWVSIVLGNPRATGPSRLVTKPPSAEAADSFAPHVGAKHGIVDPIPEETLVDEFTAKVTGGALGRRIDGLVHTLGSETAQTRDDASRQLRELGRLAIPALRRALRSSDEEIRGRAASLLKEALSHP
jgi:hypothetical protein